MKISLILAVTLAMAAAAPAALIDTSPALAVSAKTTPKKYPDPTPEQRARMMKEAHRICKAKYGAIARVHHVDWKTRKVWCAQNW